MVPQGGEKDPRNWERREGGREHGFLCLYWTLYRCHKGMRVTLLNNYLKTDQAQGLVYSSKPEAERNGGGGLGGSSNITKPTTQGSPTPSLATSRLRALGPACRSSRCASLGEGGQ